APAWRLAGVCGAVLFGVEGIAACPGGGAVEWPAVVPVDGLGVQPAGVRALVGGAGGWPVVRAERVEVSAGGCGSRGEGDPGPGCGAGIEDLGGRDVCGPRDVEQDGGGESDEAPGGIGRG